MLKAETGSGWDQMASRAESILRPNADNITFRCLATMVRGHEGQVRYYSGSGDDTPEFHIESRMNAVSTCRQEHRKYPETLLQA